MADKVYEPEVVQENPFPTDTSEQMGSSNDGVSGDNYSNTQTRQTTTPKKRVSTELLSTALNTRSRKVLQNFELQQSGGFQVGNFKEGVSGDLRITPNGLTARDQAGLDTFAIDATTGDAFFRGEVRAADFTVIDERGLISLSAFDTDSKEVFLKSTTSGTYTEIPDLSLDFTLDRETKVLFSITVFMVLSDLVDTGNTSGFVLANINGGQTNLVLTLQDVPMYTPNYTATFSRGVTLSASHVDTIPAGDHTLGAYFKVLGSGTPVVNITQGLISYVTLGR